MKLFLLILLTFLSTSVFSYEEDEVDYDSEIQEMKFGYGGSDEESIEQEDVPQDGVSSAYHSDEEIARVRREIEAEVPDDESPIYLETTDDYDVHSSDVEEARLEREESDILDREMDEEEYGYNNYSDSQDSYANTDY